MPFLMGQADQMTTSSGTAWALRAAFLITSFLAVRLLVAGVVWFAVRDCVRIGRARIQSWVPDLVVGFSWGGHVATLLVAEKKWAGPTVLLNPTVRAVSRCSCASLPKLQLTSGSAPVHVFHANGDPFCPVAQVQDF